MKNIFYILIFLLCACKEKTITSSKESLSDTIQMNHSYVQQFNDERKIEKLCKKILIEGDTLAFRELRLIYTVSEHQDEFLYFSTFMAEKHNYGPAFLTNYDILNTYKHSTMQKLAIYNLIKAYELRAIESKSKIKKLNELFPKGIPKSTEYWDRVNVSN